MTLPRGDIFEVVAELFDSDRALKRFMHELQRSLGPASGKIDAYIYQAIRLAYRIGRERRLDPSELFISNPLLIVEALKKYKARQSTCIAAIIYPSLRPDIGTKFDPKYFKEIEKAFPGELGVQVASSVRATLQIRSINYLARIAGASIVQPVGYKPRSEGQHLAAHHLLLKQVINNHQEELKIRGAQQLKKGLFTAENGTNVERAEFVNKTELLYIPLMVAYNLHDLANDLQDVSLLISNPKAYKKCSKLIEDAKEVVSRVARKDNISDPRDRQAATLQEIERQIMEAVPPHLRSRCTIKKRIKSASSLHAKISEKGEEADLSDIIGFRVIVKAEAYYYETPDYNEATIAREGVACREIYKNLTKKLTQVKGRAKDFIHNPKDNGYMSLHDTFEFTEGPSDKAVKQISSSTKDTDKIPRDYGRYEVQICGEAMDALNENGPAAHYLYKKYEHINFGAADETISVYSADNELHTLPAGSTVADFLALYESTVAFTADDIDVERDPVFADAHEVKVPWTTLRSGDRVTFSLRADLMSFPEHRSNLISALTSPEAKRKLMAANRRISRKEQSSKLTP